MNTKFIRALIIINGILIPVFIVFVLGSVILEEYENRWANKTDLEVYEDAYKNNKNNYEIRYSSPNKIPNSNNYYVAV